MTKDGPSEPRKRGWFVLVLVVLTLSAGFILGVTALLSNIFKK